jgi:hypothetical protein
MTATDGMVIVGGGGEERRGGRGEKRSSFDEEGMNVFVGIERISLVFSVLVRERRMCLGGYH